METSYSLPYQILYSSSTQAFDQMTWETVLRFYKTIYETKEAFYENVIHRINIIDDLKDVCDYWESNYDHAELLDFKDAFAMKFSVHKKALFDKIDSSLMMDVLQAELIASKTIEIKRKSCSHNCISDSYTATYETYRADFRPVFENMENVNLQNPIWRYAVKCWCPSTGKPHFIWISKYVSEDPLDAIASTFQVHSFIVPHIKAIKRQGDLLFVELNKDIDPDEFGVHDNFDNYVNDFESLTAETYFNLLTIES